MKTQSVQFEPVSFRPVFAVSAAVLAMMAAPAAFAQSLAPSGARAAPPPAATPPAVTAPAATPPAAAATLPNSFDQKTEGPAPGSASSRGPQVASSEPEPAAQPSDPAKVAAAETMLKRTISAMQAGTPNYADMSPDLGGKVRAQATTVTPVVQGFGALQSVKHVGHQSGAELFDVVFAQQATQWVIGQADDGKIVVLLFRPAQ